MKTTTFITVTASALLLVANAASAQQGTTLAGPAQGSKSNRASSTQPSAASGANGSAMTRGGAATATDGAASEGGAMSTGSGASSGAATTR